MSFNSFGFLFIFLPVTLAFYYKLRSRWVLVAASLVYYALLSFYGLFVFAGSLIFNYLTAYLILKDENAGKRKLYLALGASADILLLAFFKYFGFGIADKISVPGISFYIFCEIAFIAECYKGTVDELSVKEYAFLTTFFPKLLEGPITLPQDLLLQGEGKMSISWEKIYRLTVLFTLGMFKKVIIADTLGKAVDYGYTNQNVLHTGEALVIILSYALQLYFDFSGYCDMAEAVAGAFGFELPVNFKSPYRSKNIIEFWKSWHITLTGFFTKYIYIPLGGSRRGELRTYLNILIVFFISGLWHGKGAGFIVWGMLHGVLYVITRAVMKGKKRMKIKNDIGVILTFIYVNIAWVFFRAPSLKAAGSIFKSVGELWFPRFNYGLAKCFNIPELWYVIKLLHLDSFKYSDCIIMLLLLAVLTVIVLSGRNAHTYAEKCRINIFNTLFVTVLFVWSVLSFEGVATYLYVNF